MWVSAATAFTSIGTALFSNSAAARAVSCCVGDGRAAEICESAVRVKNDSLVRIATEVLWYSAALQSVIVSDNAVDADTRCPEFCVIALTL
jgi:hypothetical protein